VSEDGKVAAVGAEKDNSPTINGTWFSRLAIFSKRVRGAIQAFCAIVRGRRSPRRLPGQRRRQHGSSPLSEGIRRVNHMRAHHAIDAGGSVCVQRAAAAREFCRAENPSY
jgi:hypothetical protein